MWILVLLAGAAVVYMGQRVNALNSGVEKPAQDDSKPPLGVRGALSPASGKGNPFISRLNALRLRTTYHNAGRGTAYYQLPRSGPDAIIPPIGPTALDQDPPQAPAIFTSKQVNPRDAGQHRKKY